MELIDDGNYTYHYEIAGNVFYFFRVIGFTRTDIVFETMPNPPSQYDGLRFEFPKELSDHLVYLEQIEYPRKRTNNPVFSRYVRNAFQEYDDGR